MNDSSFFAETVSNTQKPRICYLAAPINTSLETVEELLKERQIQPIISADLASTGSTFLEGITDSISDADLFIAVLSSSQSNDNVYVELGIAIAKERRILILAPQDSPLLLDIAELPTIRADATNRDAISFMLDQVLSTPPKRHRSQLPLPEIQKGQPLGDIANELLARLDASSEHIREDEIERLITLALSRGGYSNIANNPLIGDSKYDKRPDLIIWSDEFGPWIGNPLIIEVKRTLKRKVDYVNAVQQVLSYLQVSQTRSALILYSNKTASIADFSQIAPPNIFFLDVHELLNAMRTKSFAEIMINLRNRRVHGIDAV